MHQKVLGTVGLMALISGCTSNEIHFEQRSTLESSVSSLVLYDDGVVGHASMNEQTCKFDTFAGMILADNDIPSPDERIADTRGEIALAISDAGIHVLDNEGWNQPEDIPLTGVLGAKMTAEGFATLRQDGDGCRVEWRNDTLLAATGLDNGVCDGLADMTVNFDANTVWLSSDNQVLRLDRDGSTTVIDASGDQVAFDATKQLLYVATTGAEEISAYNEDNSLAWSIEAKGAVHDLTDLGARGAAVAVLDSGKGAFLDAYESASGDRIAHYQLPALALAEFSMDASSLALITDERVYFYDTVEGEAPVRFNEVDTEPADMFEERTFAE